MSENPWNAIDKPGDLVARWLGDVPRWNYSPEANFYAALIFMRERMLAIDDAEMGVSRWLRTQDSGLLGPLKNLLKKLEESTGDSTVRRIYSDVEDALASRLLRSRSDGRTLTNEALMQIFHQVQKFHNQELEKLEKFSAKDRQQIELVTSQIRALLEQLNKQDFLYETFEPARSMINAFKQQRSVVSEILLFYKIPKSINELKNLQSNNNYKIKNPTILQANKLFAESLQDIYKLNVSDKSLMAIALRQAYWFFYGKSQNIGTKGHEWEAFASSAFDIKEPLFKSTRNFDKTSRVFESKLKDKLVELQQSIGESQRQIEVTLGNAIKSMADIQLLPNSDVTFEVVPRPVDDVFQQVSYKLPGVFQLAVENLCLDLSADIYHKFNTKDFKIFMNSNNQGESVLVLYLLKDAKNKNSEIHQYVLQAIRKLRVDINLKFGKT